MSSWQRNSHIKPWASSSSVGIRHRLVHPEQIGDFVIVVLDGVFGADLLLDKLAPVHLREGGCGQSQLVPVRTEIVLGWLGRDPHAFELEQPRNLLLTTEDHQWHLWMEGELWLSYVVLSRCSVAQHQRWWSHYVKCFFISSIADSLNEINVYENPLSHSHGKNKFRAALTIIISGVCVHLILLYQHNHTTHFQIVVCHQNAERE